MNEHLPQAGLAAVALAALLLSAGCVETARDAIGDDELEAQNVQSVSVRLSAENASANLSHLGLEIDSVFVHNASVPQPEGFFELNASTPHADLVAEGEADEVRLGARTLPAGTYDQVVLRVDEAEIETSGGANASAGDSTSDSNATDAESNGSANDSGDDHGDHDHAHGNASDAGSEDGHDETADESRGNGTSQGFDIPVNVTFEVTPDTSTGVHVVLDADASSAGGAFQPVLDRVEVTRDGDIVELIDDPDVGFREAESTTPTSTPPPAARMSVFDSNGDKVHEPDFQAESGAFVNSLSDPFAVNASIGFSATESEAVADGAAVESYRWDFGDNETATGINTNHSYDEPGAYEVTLTARDSLGVTDEHNLRVVVLSNWTDHEVDTSFEEGEGNWTAENGARTSWSPDSPGYESDTAWHVSGDIPGTAYGPYDTATLRSPNVTIPEDWIMAGYSFQIRGQIGGVFGCVWEMIVEYQVDGEETVNVVTYDTRSQPEWTAFGGMDELAEHKGSEVSFEFTFQSTCDIRPGEGWYVDAVAIGGVNPANFNNAHLLEAGGHGGHDHEH